MKKKRYILHGIAFLILILSGQSSQAQQAFTYNQYMDNLGPINPTWYMADPSATISSLGRRQWVGVEDAPATFVLSGHLPLPGLLGATGVNMVYDRFGPEKYLETSAFFAKAVRLTEQDYLSVSMSVGYSRYDGRYSLLDPSDPAFKQDFQDQSGILGFGVMYYIPERFFAGFSVPRLTMRELGIGSNEDNYLNTNYYIMAGYLGQINDVFKLKTVLLATESKRLQTILDASLTLYVADVLGIGASYRTTKEMGMQISFLPSARLRFGYSFQFGTAGYSQHSLSNDSHEVGFSYRFGKNPQKRLL